ncbi:MAG: hypothetical protein COT34_01645 [Candidatus Nealsonbacteria bacterium CG08_land_8_20_14_0_20_43_11]|uniref:Uncharacterized protein n=1 Tax=Candidatus Nealsonbacteria bacterium CG08_land_8_20_14_0_20_43_11 TaxID=1974706 RepID=A0A2M6T0X5_9BACT|nr:MAG: hypothetical protein COT34_01645 [Candidatus Nealsonbacteria bacterium CG08_land_8_20_14_0_20_43_11]
MVFCHANKLKFHASSLAGTPFSLNFDKQENGLSSYSERSENQGSRPESSGRGSPLRRRLPTSSAEGRAIARQVLIPSEARNKVLKEVLITIIPLFSFS